MRVRGICVYMYNIYAVDSIYIIHIYIPPVSVEGCHGDQPRCIHMGVFPASQPSPEEHSYKISLKPSHVLLLRWGRGHTKGKGWEDKKQADVNEIQRVLSLAGYVLVMC